VISRENNDVVFGVWGDREDHERDVAVAVGAAIASRFVDLRSCSCCSDGCLAERRAGQEAAVCRDSISSIPSGETE
jgi:hypothetical protein